MTLYLIQSHHTAHCAHSAVSCPPAISAVRRISPGDYTRHCWLYSFPTICQTMQCLLKFDLRKICFRICAQYIVALWEAIPYKQVNVSKCFKSFCIKIHGYKIKIACKQFRIEDVELYQRFLLLNVVSLISPPAQKNLFLVRKPSKIVWIYGDGFFIAFLHLKQKLARRVF